MKRVFILCMLLLQVIVGHAQLQATLNVDSNPTPEISEWVNRNDLAILTVTNTNQMDIIRYRIKVTLSVDGNQVIETNNNVPMMEADFGTETFLADEIIPYNALVFNDSSFNDQVTRTGMLPPGSYSFCIQLLNEQGDPLTMPEEICRPMIITDYQMPELLDPVDNRSIDPILINSIMFKWTPLAPMPDERSGLVYLIAVSEVQPGQTPSQAFSVNYPIIEEEVSFGTQFTWPTDIEAPDEDQQYVWGIKPMTDNGSTFRAQNNGFVDYGVFTIRGNNKSGNESGDDKDGDNSIKNNKDPFIPEIINCNANPEYPGNPNNLSNHIIFMDTGLSYKYRLTGLNIIQQKYWLQTVGGYKPIDYQLTTHIEWDQVHPMEIISANAVDIYHDYNSSIHNNFSIPTTINIHFRLVSRKSGMVCEKIVPVELKDSTFDQDSIDKLKECDFPSQRDFERAVSIINSDPNSDPLKIEIFNVADFTEDIRRELLYPGVNNYEVELNVSYDNSYHEPTYEEVNDPQIDRGEDSTITHTYTKDCVTRRIPQKVCLTYTITRKIRGEIIVCEKTYCLELSEEFQRALDDLKYDEGTGDDDSSDVNDKAGEEECACLDKSSVTIPDLTMDYTANGAGTEHTLTIPGSPAALQSIIDCMATSEQFEGMENMDGHPEYNYQEHFFTGTVTHEWHIPDAINDPSNTHMFTVLEDTDQPLAEFVTVTFHIVNDNAGIDCYFTQDVPVPHDAYNAINGTEECECDDDTTLTEPVLTLLRPDVVEEPREILFGGITAYRDYLLNCNSNYSLSTHSMDVNINWGEDHNEESIVNAGPFTHAYDTEDHQIPSEICVTFTITPLFPSSDGQACEVTTCLPVPIEWLELNTTVEGEGDIADGDSIFAGEHVDGQGEFEIVIDSITGDGPYSGTGITHIPWLLANVAVEFTDITVDADANLVSGEITVIVADTAPAYPYGCVGMGHDNADDIQDWLTTDGAIVEYTPALPFLAPLEAPFGIEFPGGDIIAVSSMVFKPAKSEFNLLVIKEFQPDVNPDQVLGFKACDTDFHLAAPVWPPERLELLEDITLGNVNNKITFTFKAPVPGTSPGCFIEWGSTGITNYAVELDVDFTREWLIPVDEIDGTEKSTANLVGAGTAWEGIVLTGNLEESILSATIPDPDNGTPTDSGAHDFIILADEIAMDMSDTMNTPGMAFPPIYTGETTNLFRGFYMDELTVKFSPNKMNTPSGGPIEVSINDIIIDDTGITLTAEVENLIAFGGAEVGDMVASVDRIYLEILSSNFVEAGVEGRIAIPVNEGNGIENSLAYTALFNNPLDPALNNNFQIILEPDQPIQNDLFGGGQFTLDETSNLTGYFDKDKRTFTMDLNGDFAWEDATVGPVDQINMALGFEGLGFDYDSSLSSNKLSFNAGNWAFASPQKKAANFPVTIEEIKFNQMPTTGNQLMRGKLNFDLIFNLSKKIGGQATLGIEGAITDTKSSGGKTFDPELLGVVIDEIHVSADLAAVKIDGMIAFRTNDPVYGNGFLGTLDAEFKAGGIKVSALAEFGNTTYNHTSPYRYWRVEAAATFPAPGITFLPGIAFRGFGGGAFQNMIATPDGSDFIFTPEYDQLGFRAKAVIATTPKEETFNADVGLLAAFSGSGGMTNIAFTGDFFVGAKIIDRSEAKIDGAVGVSYNFPDKRFILSASVNVNAPPITTPSPMNLILDIDGKKNEWFFKFGEPDQLNTVNISGVSLYEYLMFGNKIPFPGGFTTRFKNNYYSAVGNYPYAGTTGSGGVGSNTEQGKGFAMGIGFMFDKSGEYKITKFGSGEKKHVLGWDLAAGAELHLSYMQYVGSCDGYTPLGINGYRAKGGLGMYGTAGARVTRYKKNGNTKWNINLASIKAGAWITGEFPKPVYAAGAVEGEVSLFNDLLAFDFYQTFEYGTYCNNGSASSGAPVTQGDAAAEQQNALITYVKASPSANFPLQQPVIAKFGLTPDVAFDVSEQQSNGTVEMRTFKMVKTQSFKIENETTGAWEFVNLGQKQNNLGEYLYIKQANTMAATIAAVAMPPAPSFGLLGIAPAAAVYTSSPAMGISGLSTTTAVTGPGSLTSFPVTPSSDYDDLPPDPDPIINDLLYNRKYKFTVTATLKEYVGNSWVTAVKNDGTPVTQTITKTFSTGPIVATAASATRF